MVLTRAHILKFRNGNSIFLSQDISPHKKVTVNFANDRQLTIGPHQCISSGVELKAQTHRCATHGRTRYTSIDDVSMHGLLKYGARVVQSC